MINSGIESATKWLKEADAVLVTASNGFSISEGLNLFANDERLRVVLGDYLCEKYQFTNLLTAMSHDFPSELDRWRVYARVAEYYVHNYHPGELMEKLKTLLEMKPSFIWTSNVDHHFPIAGFDNTLEVEGNWQEGVCSTHPKEHGVVQIEDLFHQIYEKDQNDTLKGNDLPICDECGEPLVLNVPGPAFQMNPEKIQLFEDFVENYQDKNLVVLELGIGPQNQMIKGPSMQLVAANPKAHFITINKGQLYIPDIISNRSVGFSASIIDAFNVLIDGKGDIDVTGPSKPRPQLTPEEQEKQEQVLKNFYPSYMINQGNRPGEMSMYITIDKTHISHLHMVQYGRGLMYSFGDAVTVHCFTQGGHYHMVRLGLNKEKGEVHGFYVDAGTFIALEIPEDQKNGFSQVSTNLPANSTGELFTPKVDQLINLFPAQQDLIKRLSVKD